MDSSFCTSPPVEESHTKRVAASSGERRGIRRSVVEMIFVIYRYVFKPALFALSGPYQQCRHPISCSEFAKQQFLTQPLPVALRKSVLRVASCHPWSGPNFNCREDIS